MPFDPRAVANRLLELGRERNIIIDPMKLQKLIYYAHGWHLALTGRPLTSKHRLGKLRRRRGGGGRLVPRKRGGGVI